MCSGHPGPLQGVLQTLRLPETCLSPQKEEQWKPEQTLVRNTPRTVPLRSTWALHSFRSQKAGYLGRGLSPSLEMESKETDLHLPPCKDEVKINISKSETGFGWHPDCGLSGLLLIRNKFWLSFLNNTFCSLKVSRSYTMYIDHIHPPPSPSNPSSAAHSISILTSCLWIQLVLPICTYGCAQPLVWASTSKVQWLSPHLSVAINFQ